MGNFKETVNKVFRSLQRTYAGESNRIILTVGAGHPMAPMAGVVNIPNPDNRLEFETSRVVIEGKRGDVHRVRCLDQVIGELSASFNGRAAEKIGQHIADLAGPLARIKAYKIVGEDKKVPVDQLEYKVTTIKLSPIG